MSQAPAIRQVGPGSGSAARHPALSELPRPSGSCTLHIVHATPPHRVARAHVRRRRLRGTPAVLACVVSVACQQSPTEPQEPAEVLISAPNPVMVVGETQQAQAVVLDQFGRGMEAPTTWSVSPPGIVEVSASGQITAVSPGEATLRASAGGVTGSGVIRVVEPFRLEASLETSAALDSSSGLWFCDYTARVRGVGGRGDETAEVTRVEMVALSASGAEDRRVFPSQAIREPVVRTGESRTLIGVDKSPTSDPTVTLTLLVGYLQNATSGTLTAPADC